MKVRVLGNKSEPMFLGERPDERVVNAYKIVLLDVRRAGEDIENLGDNPVRKILIK